MIEKNIMKLELSLLVLLFNIQSTFTRFTCPKDLKCYCFTSGLSEYHIHCATNVTRSSAFDITIKPEEFVKIQCKNSPDWTDFLLGSNINVGPVKKLAFNDCALPKLENDEIIMSRLKVTDIEYLKYEGFKENLTSLNLEVFPNITNLALSNNNLGDIDPGLLNVLPFLKQLELRNTNIYIPDGFFDGAKNLKALELSNNKLKNLKPNIFKGLKRIELLNLWKNEFTELDSQLFHNLSTLAALDIHQNNLTTLPVDIFVDLQNLAIINFSSNNFSSLPEGIFRNNPKLKIFKLLYNKRNLTSLPSGLFANHTNLMAISFFRSGLQSLPTDLFQGVTGLIDLNLNSNYLTALPADLFKDTIELHSLSISFNDLKILPDGIFENTKKMVKLDLSSNHLKFINEDTLIGLESLQELNMENNDLEFIHVDAFTSLTKLKIAKFANNKLTLRTNLFDIFGHVSPFHSCHLLEKIYLSHNNISQIYSDWVISNTHLVELDLSYNSFDYIENEDLQFMSNRVNIDLRHNSITQINLVHLEYMASNLTAMKILGKPASLNSRNITVFLEDNPIECDCNLYSLLRFINHEMHAGALNFVQLDLTDLTCNGPEYMKEKKLAELKSSELKCLVENKEAIPGDPCASKGICDCWLRPADKALLLDCAGKNLTTAPEWIDVRGVNYVELNLADNHLLEAPNMEGRGYNKVRNLNLTRNQIMFINETLISQNLKVLNLNGNKLTFINSEVLKKISNSSQITKLTLHDNPWSCNCSSRDLLSFVQSNFLDIPDLLNITCAHSNVSLCTLSVDELCPDYDTFIIISSTVFSVCAFLLGFTLALYFRFQKQIKIWLYSKNLCLCLITEEEIDRDKMYDVFVSYSHKDEEFVIKELVTRLEDGPKPYKCCIHSRDWLAGDWIPMQIARSIDLSRRTIIVLSANFLESVWARLEFQTAHKQAINEKRTRLIIVLYGEIGSTDNLDTELKSYLQMNTYIKWGDPWFWQKLRYAMPHSVAMPTQVDQVKNQNLMIVSKAIAKKKGEVKIIFEDEIEKHQGIIKETFKGISDSFSEKCRTEDKYCLTE